MPLKVALVTSQVTYMPDNYQGLLEGLLEQHHELVRGVFFLKNLDRKTLKSAVGLPLLGATKISKQLWCNIIELPLHKRERLVLSYGIPLLTPKSMNEPEVIEWIKKNEIDLIINMRTRCIYKTEILAAPKLGCINIHHGILPTYRGTLCDLYALVDGRAAGHTIHVMDKKIDNGDILSTTEVSSGDKDYLAYLKKTASVEAKQLGKLLEQISNHGSLPKGLPNKTDKKVYTKNPTRKEIQSFLKQGFQL